ncbi:MAG: hypothetical protein L6R42_007838, partial [Xanthoria sp. 1 TBL-2021]
MAKNVLFDGNKRAVDVTVDTGGISSDNLTYTTNTTKEVILSAGAFRSPQMLMLSGIGPASTLKDNDVEVLADGPGVGQN